MSEEVPVQSLRDIELTFDSGESEVRHVGHDPSVSIALCQFSNVDWRDVWRAAGVQTDAPHAPDIVFAQTERLFEVWRARIEDLGKQENLEKIACFPMSLKNLRSVSRRLDEILTARPGILVIGAGCKDHELDDYSGKPLLETDEFSHRLEWISAECVWRGVRLAYALDTQVEADDRFNEAYLPVLQKLQASGHIGIVRQTDADNTPEPVKTGSVFGALFKKTRVQDPVAQPTRPIPNAPAYVRSKRTGVNVRLAQSCVIKRNDGSDIVLTGNDAEMVDVTTQMEASNREEARTFQGRPDPETLGGRSRFERMVQRSLVDRLSHTHRDGLKRTMIIGDSIRMRISNGSGHGIHAYEKLIGKTNLVHVPHNCGGSKVGRAYVEKWMQAKPDIVAYNSGLHDLTRTIDGIPTASSSSLQEYEENLKVIFACFRDTGVKALIWATLTPVDEAWHSVAKKGKEQRRAYRLNEDVERYNEVGSRVARQFDADIIDFNKMVLDAGTRQCLVNDGVHLSTFGGQRLGHALAERIARNHL